MSEADGLGGLPLMGRRVLITRAAGQASGLAERLRELGAETILIPTIEIVPPRSFVDLDGALRELSQFDWVGFTSANGVRAFRERADVLGIKPSGRRIAVVGPATARAVEAIGLSVDRMPLRFTAEALAEVMSAQVRGRKVLLVLAEGAGAVLERALTEAGGDVVAATAYGNRIPSGSLAAMKELLEDAARVPDAVTFTSASTAGHLMAVLEAVGLRLPADVARISIGPVTSAALAKLGIPADAEAAESTLDALVLAVVGRIGRR